MYFVKERHFQINFEIEVYLEKLNFGAYILDITYL